MSKQRLVTRMAADEDAQRQYAMEQNLQDLERVCLDIQRATIEVVKLAKKPGTVKQMFEEQTCVHVYDELLGIQLCLDDAFDTLTELEQI